MADGDSTPSPVTIAAFHLLRQGLSVGEVSARTGLPLALVELIAAEQSDRPRGAAPHRAGWPRSRVVTAAIVALAVTSFIAALVSVTLHNPSLGIISACCSAVSLLAVHLYSRSNR